MSFPLQYPCITHVYKYICFLFLYLVSEQASWHAKVYVQSNEYGDIEK